MIKTIPEQNIFICDCCLKENPYRVKNAKLTLHRHALDYLNQPAADGTISIDLCDDCETEISKTIDYVCDKIRKKQMLCP